MSGDDSYTLAPICEYCSLYSGGLVRHSQGEHLPAEHLAALKNSRLFGGKYAVAHGATRSERAPAYHLVPGYGLRRVAERFKLGADKHGEGNWRLALVDETSAHAFASEAYNHMIEHARKMAQGLESDDDHLGAIGWAVEVLATIEHQFGKRWTELAPMRERGREGRP